MKICTTIQLVRLRAVLCIYGSVIEFRITFRDKPWDSASGIFIVPNSQKSADAIRSKRDIWETEELLQ